MSTQPSLFPPLPELPEERAHRLDCAILDALWGKGPFPLSDSQRRILEILRTRRGLSRAVSIGEIGEKLKLSPRQVKSDIADLTVRFRLPIGSSRDPATNGYYLTITHQECVDSATPHIHQAVAHLRRAAVLLDKHELNTMIGQMLLELPTSQTIEEVLG